MRSSRMCCCAVSVVLLAITALGAEEPKGSLVIIGGALRFDEDEVWERIVELAGGPGAKIAVFPTASGNPLLPATESSVR